jgi:hypothetical protein
VLVIWTVTATAAHTLAGAAKSGKIKGLAIEYQKGMKQK